MDYKKKTGRMKDNNFYEIIISTGKQYDGSGGYKFICKVRARVRHYKRLWFDSARWAKHQLTVSYGFREGNEETVDTSSQGQEAKVSFSASCKTPVFIRADGSAQDKIGNDFHLTNNHSIK